MIDFYIVGNRIAEFRKRSGLTQDQLAEKIYVSRQLVSKWEKGIGTPSIDSLLDLCRVFDTSFEELLCLDDEFEVDEKDIFKGHDRLYVVKKIISGVIVCDLPDVFYQFSPGERMMILKAIREEKLVTDIRELSVKLTDKEKAYLNNGGIAL